ncbi:MAG TPA: hypothetical protein VIL45_07100 [Thermoplasmata archaeon]
MSSKAPMSSPRRYERWERVECVVSLCEYRGLWTWHRAGSVWMILESVRVPEWREWGYVLVSGDGVVPYRSTVPGSLYPRLVRGALLLPR